MSTPFVAGVAGQRVPLFTIGAASGKDTKAFMYHRGYFADLLPK